MEKINFNGNWYYYPSKNGLFGEMGAEPQPVTLPHDAVIGTDRNSHAQSGSAKGFYDNGSWVYRKTFFVPEEYKDKIVRFLFEGVYMNGVVWLNGEYGGKCPNGYGEFLVEATSLLKYGEENEIKVFLRTGEDSRWYSGAGIYRNVFLLVGESVHISPYGLKLATESADREMAHVTAEISLESHDFRRRDLRLELTLADGSGRVAGRERRILTLYGNRKETLLSRLYIGTPRLWSPDSPELYQAVLTLYEGDRPLDSCRSAFGIRILSLDPRGGLKINGETIKIYGGCIHHDNGLIGAASVDRAEERRVELLRSAGYNGIRMAHHPASPALLDACDRLGMTVMDELGDMWNVPKSTEDYSADFADRYRGDIESLVNKDYNHPSVIMYSLGNEIPEMGKPSGGVLTRELAREFRKRDGKRYLTAGVNGMVSNMEEVFRRLAEESRGSGVDAMNGIISELGTKMKQIQCEDFIVESTRETLEVLDIAGYNYAEDRYGQDSDRFDNWISVGSETFPRDLAKNWKLVGERGNVIGDYSWTSWDYLGEAGIGRNVYDASQETGGISAAFPWFIAYCGDFDITGSRRPQSYYREIVVGKRKEPYIAVRKPEHYGKKPFDTSWSWTDSVSSWDWEGFEGKPAEVEVYAMAEEVELILNGRSLGKKPVPRENGEGAFALAALFETPYEPGRLEAVAYGQGKETGRFLLETAGDDLNLAISPDRKELADGTGSLAYLTIGFNDGKGRPCRSRFDRVTVEVAGAGTLLGLGSADPRGEDNFTAPSCRTYYGEALAVIRPKEKGTITITVSADGFTPVTGEIRVI